MNFLETRLPDCLEIRPPRHSDVRGSFIKVFQEQEFAKRGLATHYAEAYYTVSRRGVLRGLHCQLPPHHHAKVVSCVDGVVLDAVLDLRRGSPAYGKYHLTELTSEDSNVLYVPAGLAHGFYVRSERATILYMVSTVYSPDRDGGVRWDSAAIPWPDKRPLLSERDRTLPQLATFDSPFRFCPGVTG